MDSLLCEQPRKFYFTLAELILNLYMKCYVNILWCNTRKFKKGQANIHNSLSSVLPGSVLDSMGL